MSARPHTSGDNPVFVEDNLTSSALYTTQNEALEECGLTLANTREILAETAIDPIYFMKFFLEHLFPGRVPWLHLGATAVLTGSCEFLYNYPEEDIQAILDNFYYLDDPHNPMSERYYIFSVDEEGRLSMDYGRFVLMMWPRGFAKTSLAGIGVSIYEICHQLCPFTLYISETGPHSKMQLDTVRRELSQNPKIIAFFGVLKPRLRDDEKWSGDLFETTTGMAMAARGRGGQIRGTLHRGHRPHKIVFDDLESKETVATDTQRLKTRDWFMSDVCLALPKVKDVSTGEHVGRIVGLGTLLHPESVMMVCAQDVDTWQTVRFGAALDMHELTKPIWPENMDTKDLARAKMSFTRAGLLHSFYLEYFNEWVATEDAKFKREYFKFEAPEGNLVYSMYLDPAISDKPDSDHSVVIVAAINDKGHIWFVDGVGDVNMSEQQKTEIFFELYTKYKPTYVGVESNAYQKALIYTLKEAMFRHGSYFEIQPICNLTNKYERIVGILSGRYAAGYISHSRSFPQLESQLLDIRPGVDMLVDWADAAAGAVALLEPFAAMATPATITLSADEYEPLDDGYFQY